MADTTNYFFNLPTVGGSSGSWGGSLNENWTKLDKLLYGASYTDGDSNTVEKIRPDLLGGSWAIDGTAVTSTAAELNYVDGVTSAIQTQLNTLTTSVSAAVPSGVIIMWSGATSAIPSGYVLCNGSNSTPDLRGRFVIGAQGDSGNTYDVGDTGGSATHTLTTAEMPSHNHSATSTDSGHTHVLPYGDSGGESDGWDGNGNSSTTNTGYANITTAIGNTGGGGAHENRPPFYALCYIMKT
jgi:hypothetical protein